MGLVDEGRTMSFLIGKSCFARKGKKSALFTKICKKFFIMNNRWNEQIFFVI